MNKGLMFWLAVASLFICSPDAQAGEKISLSFTAKKCASFHGTFSPEGFKGEVDGRIDAKCELEQNVGAVCSLSFIDKSGKTIKVDSLKGSFQMTQKGDVIETVIETALPSNDSIRARVFCSNLNCDLLHFFNTDVQKGLACIANAPPAVKKQPFQTGNPTFDL